ncbi:DEAD/DEAH box helicase family protein [Hymenobacter negativus]|uniref:DEAD/DEAH box helicase family protein n=1 Tax=Hymenobacter negativus TaxID=2795026 RepID=A0ABS0Q9I3_9BACT|nr:DEAD/DEAH box helicase family protein [Hymenobacter negativus]MBH8559247.1 DEAD/DEAH box helicase family protein [Hymenobacter negativus]
MANANKEATARIKINKLLEEAGWRFFDSNEGKANIVLEPNVKLTTSQVSALGDDFESTQNGFIDFLLLDERSAPLIVLEAKAEDKDPLVGKEQARKYARAQNCRFVLLSNGNLHYFWDLTQGSPYVISRFPGPDSVAGYKKFEPNPTKLVAEVVGKDYITLTQLPNYANEAGWKNEAERPDFIEKNHLRFLRPYQMRAIQQLQVAVDEGQNRFLFEMATGTGKTLTAAAIIKLFLRTGNARRVLFLVDRLELEDQANKAFVKLLKDDAKSIIYKEQRDEWRKAEIVVTTVQSLLFNGKYRRLFAPTDFDLVISDEAHRSIGGNARAVFEYFIGYKLGLTATPRDYLKRFDAAESKSRDPRELERRMMLDTYRTFGCESGQPTFRYSLLDGVRDGFLINPVVVDARTDITTQLLSDEGYAVLDASETENDDDEETYFQRDFEKKFFSEGTNRVLCETLMRHGLRDPVSGEFGKTIVFAVSQAHAAKLAQLLNEMADTLYPGRYQSDFAVQVTSQVPGAQQYTINFANNRLLGTANVLPEYRTSKARVCVTVGMMTTGYDCPDILNLALMRPIFSPSDFVQIKGRGTRKHNFLEQLFDQDQKELMREPNKTRFKLFDFFANCEYFEERFNYDEVLKLPARTTSAKRDDDFGGGQPTVGNYEHLDPDAVRTLQEQHIGLEGMKIDRMFFEKFEEQVQADDELRRQVETGQWQQATEHLIKVFFDKPQEYFNLEKLRRAAGLDRRLTVREVLEKAFGRIPSFKSKDELLEEEFDRFVLDYKPADAEHIVAMKYFFKAYITDGHLRTILDDKNLNGLYTNPSFGMMDYEAVPQGWRNRISNYIKDYVPLNRFL